MKRRTILSVAVFVGCGAVAHGQIVVTSHTYYAYANIINTTTSIITGNSDSGSLIPGGSVGTSITGVRSDNGVTTEHLGESSLNAATNSNGMSGSGYAHSKTTYLSGGNSFISQATDSGFGQTVQFTVASAQTYNASLNATITKFNRAYQPDGPVGSFFYIFRLLKVGQGFLFNYDVQNSLTLPNLPFNQSVLLTPGEQYELSFIGACNGTTINFAVPQAGAGAFGETEFNGSYSLQAVPEPATVLLLGTGLAAVLARRKKANV